MELRQTLILAHETLEKLGVDHALIEDLVLATLGIKMSFEEYMEFLRQYWGIFGPPRELQKKQEYPIVKLQQQSIG